jgi:hypothetical protein
VAACRHSTPHVSRATSSRGAQSWGNLDRRGEAAALQRPALSRLASTITDSNIAMSSFSGSALTERLGAHPIGVQPVSAAQWVQ